MFKTCSKFGKRLVNQRRNSISLFQRFMFSNENNKKGQTIELNQTKENIQEQQNKLQEQVLFKDITPYMTEVVLNTPMSLNALNLNMIQLLQQRLADWNSSTIQLVCFEGSGGKAFCAGGDIKSLYLAKQKHSQHPLLDTFFRQEFQLDYMLAKMQPMQLSIYDGYVMGGGVGISINSAIRIATEQSVFSMPEAQIGFFTDIGSSFFLPRLKHRQGLWLALTGSRLKGQELVEVGVANYYVKSEQLDQLKEQLERTVNSCSDSQVIQDIVSQYAQPVNSEYHYQHLIQPLFAFKTYQEFAVNLKKQAEQGDTFAQKVQAQLAKQCPLSLRIIFEQFHRGEGMSLEECFKMDFRITQRFMEGDDFFEGVRCLLVDRKDTPKWKYTDPLQISQEEVDSYFLKLPDDKELELKKR